MGGQDRAGQHQLAHAAPLKPLSRRRPRPRPAMPPAPQRPPPPTSWRRRHRPAEAEPRRTRRSCRRRNSRRLCRGHGGLSPPQRRGRGPSVGAGASARPCPARAGWGPGPPCRGSPLASAAARLHYGRSGPEASALARFAI